MSITFDILGAPGRDNALLVRVDSGQSIERLLFDCGDGCLNAVPFSEIQAIDHLFLSHLHMDHIGGFDYFFRCVFNRETKLNQIWGPPETARILHHRFQGFLWNLHAEMSGTWRVTDISESEVSTTRFELSEAFAIAHEERSTARQPYLVENLNYVVEAHTMDHRTPTIAYVVREKPRSNIDTNRLAEMGLKPGAWMKHLKDPSDTTETVLIGGVSYSLTSLRESLIVETPGDSIAYLTDFLLDETAIARLAGILKGCQTVVCEGQYRHSDLELARKNHHMTTALTGQLARRAQVGNLILFHLSDRYNQHEWLEMLLEARAEFAATAYPVSWHLQPNAE
ncbi:MAG: Ribonuclease [Planctomycetaceae bacterium]|nr:Ribonuclease [Planctomycetaceae bacterium]